MSHWLIVAGDFTPLGGMDAANHALARYLAARAPVHLVTHRAWDDLRGAQLSVECVPRPLGAHAVGAPLLDRAGRRAWAARRATPGARAIVNGGNCRIAGAATWVHYLHAAYRPELRGSIVRRAKHDLVHRRDLAAERAALASASLVICNSVRTRDDVLRAYAIDPARVRVVYYGVDADRFSPVTPVDRDAAKAALGADRQRPLVGFVGALGDRRKGFDTLFTAWRALCADARWDADLVAVGVGSELAAWRQRAADAGLAARIRFAGFRSDVPAVLAALDGFVHPARYEAYGLSPHEALCRGVPAIVSASAGVAERYGAAMRELLLRNPEDAEELAARLRVWRERLEAWRDLAASASRALRARTWDVMAEEIVSAVEAA
ncbi:MAG TPA: glycosyltransferase family 4 protein [Vicinamibacterales bacterium]|nr:glycosyltransferase family 4 protein [Vicinamibacterales bacterium]